MILGIAKPRSLKTLQALLLVVFLFVQGSTAVLAAEHAIGGGSRFMCGQGNLPLEALVNIRKLLALQGDTDDDESVNCNVCCNLILIEPDEPRVGYLVHLVVETAPKRQTPSVPILPLQTGAAVGLRAPPFPH